MELGDSPGRRLVEEEHVEPARGLLAEPPEVVRGVVAAGGGAAHVAVIIAGPVAPADAADPQALAAGLEGDRPTPGEEGEVLDHATTRELAEVDEVLVVAGDEDRRPRHRAGRQQPPEFAAIAVLAGGGVEARGIRPDPEVPDLEDEVDPPPDLGLERGDALVHRRELAVSVSDRADQHGRYASRSRRDAGARYPARPRALGPVAEEARRRQPALDRRQQALSPTPALLRSLDKSLAP